MLGTAIDLQRPIYTIAALFPQQLSLRCHTPPFIHPSFSQLPVTLVMKVISLAATAILYASLITGLAIDTSTSEDASDLEERAPLPEPAPAAAAKTKPCYTVHTGYLAGYVKCAWRIIELAVVGKGSLLNRISSSILVVAQSIGDRLD